MYTVTSFIFFVLAGVMAELMRAELARPGLQFLSNEQYNQLFTIHGTIMMFLFAPALAFGFANYIVPLQIGAPDVSFPRLNALAYWMYAFGGTMVVAGFLTPDGAADFGWFAYAPLNSSLYSPGTGADLWIFGLTLSGLGTILGAVNLVTTILTLRAPGMTMFRMPIFCWNMLITGILVLVAFPVFAAAVARAVRPTEHFGAHVFDAATAVRCSGSICSGSSAIPRSTSSPCRSSAWSPRSSRSSAESRCSATRVWSSRPSASAPCRSPCGRTTCSPPARVLLPFFALLSFLIAVPTGVKFFNWIGTMWRGQLTFETPMLWAVFFLITFLFGGLTGVLLASPPIDFHVTDSYFVVAHFHYVVFGSAVFGGYAGHLFLVPEDDRANARRAIRQAPCLDPVHRVPYDLPDPALAGHQGHAASRRRLLGRPTASPPSTRSRRSVRSCSGPAARVLLQRHPRPTGTASWPIGDDPWGYGNSLEWATSCPPPRHNFVSLPRIRSERPAFDLHYPEVVGRAELPRLARDGICRSR